MSALSSRVVFRSSIPALVGLASLLLASRDARASGYLTARFGTDHGTPAQPNTFAVYYNPAALGGTKGTTITGDLSAMLRFARYTRTNDALSPSNESFKSDPAYVASNTGTANLTNVLMLPFVGVNTDFGTKNLRAGYAAYVPFGGIANWSRREGIPGSPGTQDSVSRWHNISGQVLAIYNTFAVAYRVHPRFSVGASISPVIHYVSTVRARNSDGSDDTVVNGQLIEGRTFLEASGVNLSASAGVYFEPTDTLRLGLAYLAQPGFGETRVTGTLETQLGATAPAKQQVDFLQTYPDIVRFGADWRATSRLAIRGDVEFVRWSVMDRQCVVNKGDSCNVAADGKDLSNGKVILNLPRNWNNSFGIRVGPGYWINDNTELFGSVAVTSAAVPKETIDVSTNDSTRLYFTAGAKFDLSKHFALGASYNHIYFVPVNTNGQNDQNIPGHPANAPGGGDYNASRSPSANGRYSSQIGFLNVNAAYTF